MSDTSAAQTERSAREVVIEPPRGIDPHAIAELWTHRHLLWSMAGRRLRTRFDNLYLSVLWAIARPALMTLVLIFIKQVSGADMGGGVAYPLFLFSGLFVWFYIAGSLIQVTSALERDAGLVQKVYFPRLISPASPIVANMVELVLGAIILIPMMIAFQVAPDWKIVLLPLVLLQIMALILGVGLIFSALTLISSDWSETLNLIVYLGLFLSPVIYGPDRIPERVQPIFFFNPAAGSLMGFRASVFGDIDFPWAAFGYSCAFSAGALLIGLILFRWIEHQLLDQL